MTCERDGTFPFASISSIFSSKAMGSVLVIFAILSKLRPAIRSPEEILLLAMFLVI